MSSVSTVTALNREQVILDHMRQVKRLAHCIHRRCPAQVSIDDLVSAGTVGLIQAVDRYEPGRNVKLGALAGHRIRGAILDYLRQLDPLPRAVRRFQRDRDDAKLRLEVRTGGSPCELELAAELGLPIEKYRRLACTVQAASAVSLDGLLSEFIRPPHIVNARSRSDSSDLIDRLRALIADLPGRERTVVLGLQRGLTLREIGRELRVSESRVSQLKARAIARLRLAFGADGDGCPPHKPGKCR